MSDSYYLILSCDNQPGIVAKVGATLHEFGGNILEAQQYDDLAANRFFMRVEFNIVSGDCSEQLMRDRFAPVAHRHGMQWSLRARSRLHRVIILVSKFDHCLVDLLYRCRIGELPMQVVGIISNHPEEPSNRNLTGSIPYHHLPVTAATRPQQESQIKRIIEDCRTDLVVLARYMQILSNDMSRYLAGRCINIHHSFLPGFKGAKPYTQAFERGVK